jgi:Tol biopolymer transport system component
MTLEPGSRLGAYEILGLLGLGGMGEVYRARDLKLGRDVALKIIPAVFAADPDRLARFKREARALAALNHPNVGAIYGLEDAGGVEALVLELVEGDTLADRIQRGPLAVAETLSYARQMADALDAAHEKGLIHRDLKPANIKITPAGVVKVLDFGLAKAADGAHADTASPQTTISGTRYGVTLGTPAYMSPEQARGLAVDKRTDIWAFGCVVYEMLTARMPFRGDTHPDVIVSVLERAPDWTALPGTTPPAIGRLLRRCLDKDPRRRLRDVGDARLDIDEALAGGTDGAPPGASVAGAARDVMFQRLTDFAGTNDSPAVSPDGKMVAFLARVGGRRQIWIRMLTGGAPLQVTRDDVDHEQPRWTPDSSSLIYYAHGTGRDQDGTVWEISALGGWPRRLAWAVAGGDISPDGLRIALFQRSGDCVGLMALARDGSLGETVALLPAGDAYTMPRWSPDGRSIAFERNSTAGISTSLEIVSLSDGRRREVARNTWLRGFCWLPDGSGLIYSASWGGGVLYPPIFNLRTITIDGRRDSALTFGDQSYVQPDTHRSGKLVAGRIKGPSDIWKLPVGGTPIENTRNALRITRQTGQVRTPSVNPEGTEFVYLSDGGGHGNLWIARTDGSAVRQLTFETDPTITIALPSWSPASDMIVFVISRSGRTGLSIIQADGSGLRDLVADGRSPSWSADGRWVYYERSMGASRLEKISVEGGEPIVVREETGTAVSAISSDGSTLYYSVRLGSHIFGIGPTDTEIRRARPEDGPSELLVRISAERVPGLPPVLPLALSPDDRRLVVPLTDGGTTNLWALPTAGGAMTPLTDFGDRSVIIARSVSWSADGQFIYAAVSETETDVVLIDGLIG